MATRIAAATAALLGLSALFFLSRNETRALPASVSIATPSPSEDDNVRHRPTVSPKSLTQSSDGLQPVLEQLAGVDRADQAGLDRLFEQMGAHIDSDPEGSFADFESRIDGFSRAPLEESFFLVHTFIRHHKQPFRVVEKILDREVVEDPHNSGDSHGHLMTPSEHYDRVRAFAIRHFNDEISKRAIGAAVIEASRSSLIPRLKEIARDEPSLNVAREATRLLARLSPHPQRELDEALRDRPAEERELLIP